VLITSAKSGGVYVFTLSIVHVCVCVCLSAGYLKKLAMHFDEFWSGGRNFKGIFSPLWDRGNTYNSRSCRRILMNFFGERDVSLATNLSILVVIRITNRIKEFVPMYDSDSKNSARSADSVEVWSLRVFLLVIKLYHSINCFFTQALL